MRGYGITQSDTKWPANNPLTKPSACGPVNNSSSACCISFCLWSSASVIEKFSTRRSPRRPKASKPPSNERRSRIVANGALLSNAGRPVILKGNLAAALAGAALSANATGASADDFVAAAVGTDDVHEHVPQCFLDAIGVALTVAGNLSRDRRTIVRNMICDHVENFFLARAGEIRDGTIERFFFHLGKFS